MEEGGCLVTGAQFFDVLTTRHVGKTERLSGPMTDY